MVSDAKDSECSYTKIECLKVDVFYLTVYIVMLCRNRISVLISVVAESVNG